MKRFFALLLCLVSFSVLADTYPASKLYPWNGFKYTSASEWFTAWAASQSICQSDTQNTVTCTFQSVAAYPTYDAVTYKKHAVNKINGAISDTTPSTIASWEYGCANGGTFNATAKTCTKTCDAGLALMADGSCKKDCSGKLGQPTPSPSNEFANDGGTPTIGGCEVSCKTWSAPKGSQALLPAYQVGSGCTYTGKAPVGTGSEGTGFKPEPEQPKKPSDCTAAGMGYVSGSTGTTCVPASDSPSTAPEVKNKEVSTTGPTDPNTGNPASNNPDTTTTTKETTTDPSTGKTTEKVTTSNPAATDPNTGQKTCPAGTTLVGDNCQKSTSTTTDTSDYCSKNPTAPACGGNQNSDACTDHPERASCASLGDPSQGDSTGISSKDIGVSSITPVSLATSEQCPQGQPLPLGLGYFPMDGICMFASGIKPIILALAWLSAALITIGAFRGQ